MTPHYLILILLILRYRLREIKETGQRHKLWQLRGFCWTLQNPRQSHN